MTFDFIQYWSNGHENRLGRNWDLGYPTNILPSTLAPNARLLINVASAEPLSITNAPVEHFRILPIQRPVLYVQTIMTGDVLTVTNTSERMVEIHSLRVNGGVSRQTSHPGTVHTFDNEAARARSTDPERFDRYHQVIEVFGDWEVFSGEMSRLTPLPNNPVTPTTPTTPTTNTSERFLIFEAEGVRLSLSQQPISYSRENMGGELGLPERLTVEVGTVMTFEFIYDDWDWVSDDFRINRGGDWTFIETASGSPGSFTFVQAGEYTATIAFFMRNFYITAVGGSVFPDSAYIGEAVRQAIERSASAWAQESIEQAISLNLVPAQLQNNFNQAITRADFAALAVTLYETVTGQEVAGRMHFNDTNDINVQKAGYLRIAGGVGEGNFAPNNSLTRQEAAAMLSNLSAALGQPLPNASPSFNDNAEISDWATGVVGQMQASGIMSGSDGNFMPRGAYTMEQSIITMLRMLERFN